MDIENSVTFFIATPFCLLTLKYILRTAFFCPKAEHHVPIHFRHLIVFFLLLLFSKHFSLKIVATLFPSLYESFILERWIAQALAAFFFVVFLLYARKEKILQHLYFKKKYIKEGFLMVLFVVPWMCVISSASKYIFETLLSIPSFEQGHQEILAELEMGSPLFMAYVFTTVVMAPFVEEVIFRGGVQNYLLKKMPPYLALLSTSLLFTLMHLEPKKGIATLHFILPGLVLSLSLSLLYYKTKSLYSCTAFHASINFIAVLGSFASNLSF